MSTAADGGEGGAGGKLKRKVTRRQATAPYDRPPPVDFAPPRRGGWMSKIVDPASSLISRGAYSLFSSVFRKRLGAPPPAAESRVQNLESGEVVEDELVLNSEAEPRQTQEAKDPSDGDPISELEKLLNQKTFTREEYNRLAGLLRARTTDLSTEKDKKVSGEVITLPKTEMATQETEKVTAHERILERSVVVASGPDANLKFFGDELASPAEVAKAYMGSRPSKVSPPSLSLRSQMFRDTTASSSFTSIQQKTSTPTHGQLTASRFPNAQAAPGKSLTTPVSRGRSAIYRMSRSPYFRPHLTTGSKEGGKVEEDSVGSWVAKETALLSGTQSLKRRSSVLENDIGHVGPIRRIRQKSSLITPLKSAAQELYSSVSQPTKASEPFASTPKAQLPLVRESIEGAEDKVKQGDFSVPTQSREMANKILRQLDKLVPSPKDKGSEAKAILRDEPASKLTVDMLQRPALKDTAEKDLSKFFNVEANGMLMTKSNAFVESTELTPSSTSFGKKVVSESQPLDGAIESRPPLKGSLSFAPSLQKRSAFKMQVPLELSEFENDGLKEKDVSVQPVSSVTKIEVTPKKPAIFGEVSVASQVSEVELERKATTNGSIVSGKGVSFAFQASTIPSSSQIAEKPSPSGEQDAVPIFSFGSKASPLTFSSNLASSTEPSKSKEQLSVSRPSLSAVISKAEAGETEKNQQSGFLFKSYSTSPPSYAFSLPTSSSTREIASQSTSVIHGNGALSATTSLLASSASSSLLQTASVSISSATVSKTEPSSPFSLPSAPLFQFAKNSSTGPPVSSVGTVKPTKQVAFGIPASTDSTSAPVKESIFGLPTPSVSAPSLPKESIFGMPTSSAVSTPAPAKEPFFGVSTSSAVSAPAPAKESIFGVATSSTAPAPASVNGLIFGAPSSAVSAPAPLKEPMFGASISSTVSAPAPVKESIRASPTFSSVSVPAPTKEPMFGASTSSAVSAPAPVKESIFGLPPSVTTPLFVDSAPKPVQESIFGAVLPSTTVATPGPTDTAAKPAGGSIFGLSAAPPTTTVSLSADSASKQATESIFGFPKPSATTAAQFSSTGSGLFGFSAPSAGSVGTGGASLFAQSTTSQFSFTGSASGSAVDSAPASTSAAAAAPTSIFGVGSSQSGTTSSVFGSGFGSSSTPVFSFTQSVSASPTPSPPVFGFSAPAATAFGSPMGGFKPASVSPGNDQMNEDSMTDDAVVAASPMGSAPSTPVFGQPLPFQFGSPQPSFMPGQQTFQPGAGAEFQGNFSMGSGGGGDKSSRRFIKAKRDKHRKK